MELSHLRGKLIQFGLHPREWRLTTLARRGSRRQIAIDPVNADNFAPRWIGWAQGDDWLTLSWSGGKI